MSLPTAGKVSIPLLLEIYERGGEIRPKDIYSKLANRMNLSDSNIKETKPDGRNKWRNIVQWSKQYNVLRGRIESPTYGIWKITQKGIEYLSKLGYI